MKTSISKNIMHNLFLLCTKNVCFCFGGDKYQQNDGVAMGSLFEPVLAGIFMFELETKIYQWLWIAFLIGKDMQMIHLYL